MKNFQAPVDSVRIRIWVLDFHFDAFPAPAFHFDADTDPTLHLDPDPVFG
jgi:hypothetical protein